MKRLAPIAAFVAALLLAIPFLPGLVTGWDPIQFALGLEHFDLATHQPHPPGYLGPLALAGLLDALGLAPDRAVLWQSVLAHAGTTALVLLLGRRLWGLRAGAIAAAIFATNPLAWSAAVSGESYPLEALATTGLVLLGATVGPGASRARLALFFLAYGLSGAVRQSVPLFLLPFAAWRLWRCCVPGTWGEAALRALLAGASAVLGILAWGVPLVLLAGGLTDLLQAFGTQFFQQFGRAYSPLLGAGRAAVLHNLDGLWRFLLGALSVGGLAALALAPLARRPVPPPGDRPAPWSTAGLAAAWALPPLLWFALLFVYKPAHVLVLVPLAALLTAERLVTLPAAAARLAPVLAAALALSQAALFLAPPPAWTALTSDASAPAIAHADLDTAGHVQAIAALGDGDPDRVLVVTRDGRFSFRRAMWHLPATRVLWLVDGDSTGVPMRGVEVCEARSHATACRSGAGFWRWGDRPATATIDLGPAVRHVAWSVDDGTAFDGLLRAQVPLREVRVPPVTVLRVTDVGDGPVDFAVGPYRFVRAPAEAQVPAEPLDKQAPSPP